LWDIFISHASEDKEQVAKPLAEELQKRGLRVWYDEFSLSLGDSLRRSIDEGLAQSRFGVVVLSRGFFAKEWPQRELDGLTSREVVGGKVILPIWHGVSHADVVTYSPTLADRLAMVSERGIPALADAIEKEVRGSEYAISGDTQLLATKQAVQLSDKTKEMPLWEDSTSTTFFANRIADAFPGARELQWFESQVAVQRLGILLRHPLRFRSPKGGVREPIWWFRGLRNSSIDRFEVVSDTKVLMNHEELVIKRIAAYRSDAYYQQFVYVETLPEQPVGIYEHRETKIQEDVEGYGFSREEYAVFDSRPITREEFDDGSAVIAGAVVRTQGAELRSRYLSPYNFIIAAKFSPYNSRAFDGIGRTSFNGILEGSERLEDLLRLMRDLPRHRNDDD
jgi:hypothetical protein